MSGILVLAETRRGELRDVSLELVSVAREVKQAAGGRLTVAVIGSDAERFAGDLAADGVDEVLTVMAPVEQFEAHVWQRALESLIESEQPALVLAGHTIDSLGFAPAVAARAGLGFASDVTAISWAGELRARRGAYGDKLQAELEFPGKACTLLTVRPGIFPVASPGGGSASARAVAIDLDGLARTEHVEFVEVGAGDVDITKAEFLLSIGRGIEDKDNVPRFEQLAEKFGAILERLPAAGRRGLDAERSPGRAVRQDREAAGLPRARHLRSRPAPRRYENRGDDHRGQQRPRGPHLWRSALRSGGRPVRRRRRA